MSPFRPIRSARSHAPANTVQQHPGSMACASQSEHDGPTVGFRLSGRPRGAVRMSCKLSRNFPTVRKASGAYILSARQELRLTRKGDAQQRRTWKTQFNIILYLRAVRDEGILYIMAAERVKTVEDRKARKPLLERKRRARINNSLAELKGIVLRSLNKDSSRYTKMEKADILEMAVKHLKALRETVNNYPRHDGTSQYRNGFTQCASEVTRYIMTMDSIDDNTRSDILSHLNSTCQSMHMSVPHAPTSPPLSPLVHNLNHCTTHEDPCYHCYPMSYPQQHFLSQPPELLPHHNIMSPQPFGYSTMTTSHPKSPPVNFLEKSLTKNHSDSSLMKMSHSQTQTFLNTPVTQCHSSPTSSKTSGSTPSTQAQPLPRPEPVWRPW